MRMIRIKDIAEQAGVSPTTVSNVIHGNHKKVSPATVEKIKKLLTEYDYVPSVGARMLAGGRSQIIGVLVHESRALKEEAGGAAFQNILIRSLEQEIYRRNYYMLLHFAATPEEGIQFASIWNVEGLISLNFAAKDHERLQRKCSVPLVSIDAYYEDGRQPVANVGLDDEMGGYLMAEYLIKCGHKRIAFLSDDDVSVSHARWQGVRRACAGYPVGEESVCHILLPLNRRERERYYDENLETIAREQDALFFTSDYYASEAVAYVRDMGFSIPGDISIAGFDDNEHAETCRPRLTTIHQDVGEKAVRAVEKLFDFIDGKRDIPMSDSLPVRLVVRDSVRGRREV